MSALSPRQMYLLDSACHPLMEVFGWSTYLVGTAMQPRDGKPPRDIDVRTIVDDKQHDKLRKAIGVKGIAFLGIAIGQYLASLTGLPIDYQIQRQTEANALHDGTRNPLGHRNLDNYKGDAQTADMERLLREIEAPMPEPLNPDCREGKHRACRGDAWDVQADRECACGCECHRFPTTASTPDGPADDAA